jgi:hypothetical protein
MIRKDFRGRDCEMATWIQAALDEVQLWALADTHGKGPFGSEKNGKFLH